MDLSNNNLIHISKFLSLVLRHKPETVGMTFEKGGWLKVDDLIQGAKEAGVELDKELLRAVVEHSERKRFSFSEDGLKIRANYGHSIPIDLAIEAVEPPEFLFHGTAVRFIEAIRKEGIVPQGRQYVHLSPDEQTAGEVGRRHGVPIVFTIQSRLMHENGFKLYPTDSGIWLTETVPPEFIIFPSH
jgi:putative RNA 2'-phosphotransferase